MQAQQEQPTFEAGDRFRLMRPIGALDCTREAEWWDDDATFFDGFVAGLKGVVIHKGVWEANLDDPTDDTLYFMLRFDAFPDRKVMYIADGDYGGPFEKVAAKAVSLN